VISAARRIAFETLRRVAAEGAYASDLLHVELGGHLKSEDAALATELTMGVLRWQGLLDFLLDRLLQKPITRLDLPVALALRIGLYQLRFLGRIPARAAVNESVEVVKHARKASAAALVNAVLRRAANESHKSAESFLPSALALAERLTILHSHPQWMVERWLARYGETRTIALLQANNRAPRLCVAVHEPQRRDEVARELKADGFQIEDGQLLAEAFSVSGGNIARSAAFRTGKISVQDEASQAIPFLLDVPAGGRVLDLCAAPGGKTARLAQAAGKAGRVVATDFRAHRVRSMHEQFRRLGLQNVLVAELDAARALPFGIEFDRILVDAPCSGTGTLSRHPEIRWRLQPQRMEEFHRLQAAILRSAIANLAPGGKLVYSTCSLEREENEGVVEQALAQSSSPRRVSSSETMRILQPRLASGIAASDLLDELGQFHTFPGEQRTDGFFAAILEKN
jgi:16S rRNA (cytosine967-C5)-methyltransferase